MTLQETHTLYQQQVKRKTIIDLSYSPQCFMQATSNKEVLFFCSFRFSRWAPCVHTGPGQRSKHMNKMVAIVYGGWPQSICIVYFVYIVM